MATSPFEIDDAAWVNVSTDLIKARTWVCIIWIGILIAGGVTLGVLFGGWLWVIPAVLAALLVWALWLIRRQVPAIGYAELEDDLAIRKGIMFRTLTLIPYGRMQYIEVDAGPLATKYGFATVTLHTASADSAGDIPGVAKEEASRLRDRLSKRSESRLAGL